MIQEIRISNTGPFRDEAILNMRATDYAGKSNNVVVREGLDPILNIGVIYGANASGKTQLVYALYKLLQLLKVTGPLDLQKRYSPFYLDKETAENPSKIELLFDYQDFQYRYSVSYNKSSFTEESLMQLDGKEWIPLMVRTAATATEHSVMFIGQQEPTKCKPYSSGLATAFVIEIEKVSNIARYIRNIQVCNGYNSDMKNILWEDMKVFLGTDSMRTRRRVQMSKFLNAVGVKQNGILFPLADDAPFEKIEFLHEQNTGDGTKPIRFNQSLESAGSKWLLLLGAKVIEAIEEGSTLIVDEIDARFHLQVTQAIIQLFNNPEVNRKHAQLIITTHHVNLMDEKVLRKDQVWFVQKDEQGASELFCLADFEGVEEDTPFADWYMANRFGAIPDIVGLEQVFDTIN